MIVPLCGSVREIRRLGLIPSLCFISKDYIQMWKLTSKERTNYTYMNALLNQYNMCKEIHKKVSQSLCYYIEKNNTKKIKERRDELIKIQKQLDRVEEWITSFYEECTGERIGKRCNGISIKHINKIKKFLYSYTNKWKKKHHYE